MCPISILAGRACMIVTSRLARKVLIADQGRRGVMFGLTQDIPTRCFGEVD